MTGNVYIYRKIFEQNNKPPWRCYFCKKKVVKYVIHHLDENRKNNSPENLVPAHDSCHKRHHFAGKPRSEETRKKIAATMRVKTKQAWRDGKFKNRRIPEYDRSTAIKKGWATRKANRSKMPRGGKAWSGRVSRYER